MPLDRNFGHRSPLSPTPEERNVHFWEQIVVKKYSSFGVSIDVLLPFVVHTHNKLGAPDAS